MGGVYPNFTTTPLIRVLICSISTIVSPIPRPRLRTSEVAGWPSGGHHLRPAAAIVQRLYYHQQHIWIYISKHSERDVHSRCIISESWPWPTRSRLALRHDKGGGTERRRRRRTRTNIMVIPRRRCQIWSIIDHRTQSWRRWTTSAKRAGAMPTASTAGQRGSGLGKGNYCCER